MRLYQRVFKEQFLLKNGAVDAVVYEKRLAKKACKVIKKLLCYKKVERPVEEINV